MECIQLQEDKCRPELMQLKAEASTVLGGFASHFPAIPPSKFMGGTLSEPSCLCVAFAYLRTVKETRMGRLVILPFSHHVREPFLPLHCLTLAYLSHL
jgi:hypothetical protein